MSGKFKALSLALVALLAFGLYATTAKADVTGSFGFNLIFEPIPCQQVVVGPAQTPANLGDQPCETTVYLFDFQADLNINIAISGLVTGLHSNIGNTGLEDVILTFSATLGALDVIDTFVFAQPYGWIVAGSGQLIPACYENAPGSGECDLLFVKKRVETTVSLGGVTFSNLAILEDTTFPPFYDPTALRFGIQIPVLKGIDYPQTTYTSADQNFGFGNIVSLTGQTPSGVTISGSTGFCASLDVNNIKKHRWNYMVNPDCAAGTQEPSPKPPLFFDFETLDISGVPLAADLLASLNATCDNANNYACEFTASLTFTGSQLFNPITASFSFTTPDIFNFAGTRLILSAGWATFTIVLDGAFDLARVDTVFSLTLNPDTNPATLTGLLRFEPGSGLTVALFDLIVQRAGLDLTLEALFLGAGSVTLHHISASLAAQAGVISLEASAIFFPMGGFGTELSASVVF